MNHRPKGVRAIIVDLESLGGSRDRIIVSRIAAVKAKRSELVEADERIVLELWRYIDAESPASPTLSFVELTLDQTSAVRDALSEILSP